MNRETRTKRERGFGAETIPTESPPGTADLHPASKQPPGLNEPPNLGLRNMADLYSMATIWVRDKTGSDDLKHDQRDLVTQAIISIALGLSAFLGFCVGSMIEI